jgi:hypothetical protein
VRDFYPQRVILVNSVLTEQAAKVCKEFDVPWQVHGSWAKKATGKSMKQPVRPELSVWKVSDSLTIVSLCARVICASPRKSPQ